MVHHVKRILRRVIGTLLVIAGIVGLVVPVMPGWLLIIPGAVLLGVDIPRLKNWTRQGEQRFPRFASAFRKLHDLLHRYHAPARHDDSVHDASGELTPATTRDAGDREQPATPTDQAVGR